MDELTKAKRQLTWDLRFLELAKLVAGWSKDPSTQCGAVVTRDNRVLGMGYNGFAPRTPDRPEFLHDRAEKYPRVIHAEVNAIFDAFQKGADLRGATLYTYPPGLAPSCDRCTAHVIASGIARVVYYLADTPMSRRWEPDRALTMYEEAGVVVWPLQEPDPWKRILERAINADRED